MEVTGLKDGSPADQLAVFTKAFQETFYKGIPLQKAAGWKQAFELLTAEALKLRGRERLVLFLDELPWLATLRSGLPQALDHYWNRHWSRMPKLKVLLCGSAASWMIENLIHAKGGLHNRITLTVPLARRGFARARPRCLRKNPAKCPRFQGPSVQQRSTLTERAGTRSRRRGRPGRR